MMKTTTSRVGRVGSRSSRVFSTSQPLALGRASNGGYCLSAQRQPGSCSSSCSPSSLSNAGTTGPSSSSFQFYGQYGATATSQRHGLLRRSSLSTSAAKGFLKELQEIKEEASVETNSIRHSSTTPNAFGKASTSRTGGAGGFSTSAGANPWEYELPLAVLLYPDPKLRAPNATVTEFDDKLAEFAKHMFKVMYETDGIGLAAPQVGVNVKLMVYNPTGEASETSEEVVFINPKVVNKSKGQTLFEEGCLSFPDIMGDVKRPKSVTIEAKDLQGKTIRLDLDGLEARIFQHELDHLDGTLFHDKMAPQVFRSVKDELLALEQKFERENPGVEYQSI